jgi:hypothetical protein
MCCWYWAAFWRKCMASPIRRDNSRNWVGVALANLACLRCSISASLIRSRIGRWVFLIDNVFKSIRTTAFQRRSSYPSICRISLQSESNRGWQGGRVDHAGAFRILASGPFYAGLLRWLGRRLPLRSLKALAAYRLEFSMCPLCLPFSVAPVGIQSHG